jgi:hypothetical protein
MSVHVSSWAWKQEIGDDGAKLVLLKLADSANDDGVSWPKRETLRTECEAGHEDTVKRRLRKLRDLELVIAVPWYGPDGRQTSSTYVLPHRGMPSGARLWQILDSTPRKGAPVLDEETLLAVDAVGSFLRSGGASVHPLDFGSGGASTHPSGGAPAHPSIEEPSFEPSEDLLPDGPGESIPDEDFTARFEVELALTAALGVTTASMTSRERDQWSIVVAELAKAAATADEVTERCATYRQIWPDAKLTPMALARHWSMLGAEVDVKSSGFDAWLDLAPDRFDRQTAHDVIDDARGLADDERTRRHCLVDERFNTRQEDAA